MKFSFKVLKCNDLQPRLLYSAKLSFRMEGQIKCFPDTVKLKEFIITKPVLYEMLRGSSKKKKKIKNVNSKMITNSQISTNEPKKQKLSKHIEQEPNHRNGDHMEGYQWRGGGGK